MFSRSPLLPALGLLLFSACTEPGRPATWPSVDARLLLLFADAGRGPMRPLGLPIVRTEPPDTEPWGPAVSALGAEETLVAIFLDEAALSSIHPQVAMHRLQETRVLPPDPACNRRLITEEQSATGMPESVQVFLENQGAFVPAPEPHDLRERAGELLVPLSEERCRHGIEARPFGPDWSVLPERFEVGGQLVERDAQLDAGAFYVVNADYVDEDRVALAFFWGLVLLRRGEVLTSTTGPFVVSPEALADPGAEVVGAQAVATQPISPAPGVRRVGASFYSGREGAIEGVLAVFDVDDAGFRLVGRTRTLGAAEQIVADEQGRLIALIVNQEDEGSRGRVVGVLDSGASSFELRELNRSIARVEPTGAPSPPHAFVDIDGTVFLGDLTAAPTTWELIRESDDTIRFGRGIAATFFDGRISVYSDVDSRDLERYTESTGWQSLPENPDREVLDSLCRSAPDECGHFGLIPRMSRIWATHDELGPQHVVAPTMCAAGLAARSQSGCFGLMDIGQQPLPPPDNSPIAALRGNRALDRALMVGGSGTLIELLHSL